MKKPLSKKLLIVVVVFLSLFFAQFLYFTHSYSNSPTTASETSLVAIYSGNTDRIGAALQGYANKSGVRYLCSGWDYTRLSLEKMMGANAKSLIVESQAKTTDQNARYCAPLIRELGAKRVVLALPWYHIPRAIFLTRLYLRGSGIEVIAYATTPVPAKWWGRWEFQSEYFKFWGSLMRVCLAVVGIENWPRPASM